MKTYIWTLPIRIFHWSLAVSFTLAYILGDFESFANLHFALGAFVGTLIFFRLIFGLFGPKYARFKDFPANIKSQKEFIKTYFTNPKVYAGHNPVAAMVMLLMLIVGLFTAISGFMMYVADSNLFVLGINEHFLEETHEVLANIFLILVLIHLAGIMSEKLFHGKEGTLESIFTGYKNVEAEKTSLNNVHKAFIPIWFVTAFFFAYLAFNLPTENSEHENKIEKYEHDDDDHDDS